MSIGNKPAFPGEDMDRSKGRLNYDGMTLREYYIGQALAGGCSGKKAISAADDVISELDPKPEKKSKKKEGDNE